VTLGEKRKRTYHRRDALTTDPPGDEGILQTSLGQERGNLRIHLGREKQARNALHEWVVPY